MVEIGKHTNYRIVYAHDMCDPGGLTARVLQEMQNEEKEALRKKRISLFEKDRNQAYFKAGYEGGFAAYSGLTDKTLGYVPAAITNELYRKYTSSGGTKVDFGQFYDAVNLGYDDARRNVQNRYGK